ncbi:TniQ family protein [Marinagarivorans algicola]|uniref:TniQ family protein n=1 Tax=Marinagarivorans algicola TaxID=1513270 RepID=UPI0006B46220|nr:TniQ family protein [Marinagarivorans algicola]
MGKLLSRPYFYSGECQISYLIRVSEQNGFKHIGHLLHHAGLDWKNNRAPIHQILTGEFDLAPYLLALNLPETQSEITPIFQKFKRVVDTPYLLVKYPKVCPECLKELGYCKYEWNILPVLACIKHRKILVDIHPDSGNRLSWYRQYLNKFDNDSGVVRAINHPIQPAVIQLCKYVESLLTGRKKSASIPVILHGLEINESLSLIHFIAHYQARLLACSFKPVGMDNKELGQHYQKVWEMLHAWPDSFYALLGQYIDRPMSSKGVGGLNKHYRDLYERLHRQQENRGIARIKAEFDRYIEQYWPGVLAPERLTRIKLTSPNRNIISKKETARILGSRLERVDKLVQQEKLIPVVFKGKAHYLRNQVEAFANEITSNWTMAEACEAFQLTRYQLKQLLDADVISVLQKPDSLNRDWVIDKSQSQALIDSLREKAHRTLPPSGVVSLVGIQRQGYSIVRLILAMQSGELQYWFVPDIDHPSSIKQFTSFKVKRIG